MDPNLMYGKIAELAPQWDPFPMLQALDQMQAMPPGVAQNTMSPTGDGYASFVNPQAGGSPILPPGQQPEGVQVMPPGGAQGGAQGAAPMNQQQIAMLAAMQQRGGGQAMPRAPMPNTPGARQVQVQPVPVPQGRSGNRQQTYASIFGRR